MAAFPTMIVTNAGLALQAKVQAGATLTFTRIALGDGQLNGQPIAVLADMISQKVSVPVDSVRVVGANTCQVGGFFSNATLEQGFWWRETGIFATDPDQGEILYGYTNAGNAGDYIPTVQDTRIERNMYVSIGVAGASTVTITIPSSDSYILATEKGQPGGVATLDGNGKLTASQKPVYTASEVGADSAGTAASAVNTHNSSGTAHQSLFNAKQNKLTGAQGQIVGFNSSGNAVAQAAPTGLPDGGTQGQLLAKGASSAEWVDNPTRAFGPQTVATSAWAANTTYSAQGYGFRASVPLSGVTADHIPDVTFAMADAVSGNLAPLADTYAGGIYIYAKEQPSATVNIASVVCTKGA